MHSPTARGIEYEENYCLVRRGFLKGRSRKQGCLPGHPRGQVIGALAQLGERYNGIVEVSGSIPLGSTTRNRKVGFPLGVRTLADEFSSAGVFRV